MCQGVHIILGWNLHLRTLTEGCFRTDEWSWCFAVFCWGRGLDGITLLLLMTVKTVTDTEDTADPHPAQQLTPLIHAHWCERTHTHTTRGKTGHRFCRCYGILGSSMDCLCVRVFCIATLLMFLPGAVKKWLAIQNGWRYHYYSQQKVQRSELEYRKPAFVRLM